MKALHKVAAKKDIIRPVFNYIQIKDGFARVTNAYIAIKMPIKEVFSDEKIIDAGEEIYFEAQEWAAAKMDKASYIERDGLYFTSIDHKRKKLGTCKAIDAEAMQEIGRFPDVDVVFPDENNYKEISKISFSPSLLLDLSLAFGVRTETLFYTFYGADKSILIQSSESEAKGLLFPIINTNNAN